MAWCLNLPEDVTEEILKRLPVKSLLRLQCVCKPLLTLIRSPEFVAKHRRFINEASSPESESILVLESDDFWHLSGENLERSEHLYFPYDFGEWIMGQCNGIVCASVKASNLSTCFLWNPATREFKNLPETSIHNTDQRIFAHIVGFGFDPKTDDYKVVRIATFITGVPYTPNLHKRVEVYSLRNDCWREIEPFSAHLSITDVPDRCVSGLLFWEAYHVTNPDHRGYVLLFDITEEVFTQVDKPVEVSRTAFLTKFNHSSIALLNFADGVFNGMWVMDVEVGLSWVKRFSISLDLQTLTPCGFKLDSGELLCMRMGKEVVSFCPATQRLKVLHGAAVVPFDVFVCYRESLVPLQGEKELRIPIDPEYYSNFIAPSPQDDYYDYGSDSFNPSETSSVEDGGRAPSSQEEADSEYNHSEDNQHSEEDVD